MRLGPHRRRRLLEASAFAIFAFSGLSSLVLWPGRLAAQPAPVPVASLALDPARCAPAGQRALGPAEGAAAEGQYPAPVLRLWYPTNAPDGRMPVLLYFSGWPGTTVDNAQLVQALAGRGFAVVTVVYPAWLPGFDAAAHKRQLAKLNRPMSFDSAADFAETLQRADARVRQRAADAIRVLDMIAASSSGPPDLCGVPAQLARRLDPVRAGIFGFSLGGAVAAEAAWLDRRFEAVVNMDGWHFADAATYGVEQPYLLISDDTPLPSPADLAAADPQRRYSAILNQRDHDASMANIRRHGGLVMTITGTRHADFSDQAGQSLRRFVDLRLIAPRRAQDIIEAYVGAFFEAELAGRPSALLAHASGAYPEVHIEVWPRPAGASRASSVN